MFYIVCFFTVDEPIGESKVTSDTPSTGTCQLPFVLVIQGVLTNLINADHMHLHFRDS